MEDFIKNLKLLPAVLLVMLMASCASAPPPQRAIPSLPSNVTAKSNESEVLVQYAVPHLYAAPLLNVLIDCEMVAQIEPMGSERIIIPNGNHSIMVRLAETAERERYRKQ